MEPLCYDSCPFLDVLYKRIMCYSGHLMHQSRKNKSNDHFHDVT